MPKLDNHDNHIGDSKLLLGPIEESKLVLRPMVKTCHTFLCECLDANPTPHVKLAVSTQWILTCFHSCYDSFILVKNVGGGNLKREVLA